MVFARFLQKSEASMVGVNLIWNLTLKGSFWVLNHFWGIFSGLDIWKTTRNFWSIINFQCKFTNIQKSKIKNKLKQWKFYDAFEEVGVLLSNGLNTSTIWSIAAWQILFSLKVIINNFWDNSKWSPCMYKLLGKFKNFHKI